MISLRRKKEAPAGAFDLVSDENLAEQVLGHWQGMNRVLKDAGLTRRQLAVLLMAELQGKRRANILKRLHQKFCTLRQLDEYGEIVQTREDVGAPVPVNAFKWLMEGI